MFAKTALYSSLATAGLAALLFVSSSSQAEYDAIKQLLAKVDSVGMNSVVGNSDYGLMTIAGKGQATPKQTSSLAALTEPTPKSTLSSAEASSADLDSNTAEKKSEPLESSPVTTAPYQKSGRNTSGANGKFLPTISYSTDDLSAAAKQVNAADWSKSKALDRATGTKVQALLNWHHHGVGAVDGFWGKNTQKALQAFQQSQGLTVTDHLNDESWKALTQDGKLLTQPVLVNYKLTDNDVMIKTAVIPATPEEKAKLEGMYYESVIEGLAEKFHMTQNYLKALNPSSSFKVGDTITVYNPGDPINKAVSRVVADKSAQTLFAYDTSNKLIASYPTTVGSTATPSPTGTHTVSVKVHEPNYTFTKEDGSKLIIPPGPNNPVGLVWIGLSKPSYGIHGSPDPERISRQASAGCIRLTNWDALALLGVIQDGAAVEIK